MKGCFLYRWFLVYKRKLKYLHFSTSNEITTRLHRLADGWEVQRRQACALGHADGYRGVGLRKFRVYLLPADPQGLHTKPTQTGVSADEDSEAGSRQQKSGHW